MRTSSNRNIYKISHLNFSIKKLKLLSYSFAIFLSINIIGSYTMNYLIKSILTFCLFVVSKFRCVLRSTESDQMFLGSETSILNICNSLIATNTRKYILLPVSLEFCICILILRQPLKLRFFTISPFEKVLTSSLIYFVVVF